MNYPVILKILGLMLMSFSLSMLPPLGVSLFYQDKNTAPFLITLFIILILGFIFWWPMRRKSGELRMRAGFLIVTMFWIALSATSALPFMLSTNPHMSFTDSMFESVSGFTTTGATVIVGLDNLPQSLLYYRAQLHWLGGMGIVVLAVAIFPLLGVGGMQLYRAETPGPMKDEKLKPRITETARLLWYVYLGLTVLCAIAYWIAGMSLFDAICHAFSTISTGGFSTHDASLAYFNSLSIEMIAIIFMLCGSISFATHYLVANKANLAIYLRDAETLTYLKIVIATILIVTIVLYYKGTYADLGSALRYASFQVISMISSTGFLTADFSLWPLFVPLLLILIGFIGGCAGSTGGGLKILRVMLLYKQGMREIHRAIHPRSVKPIKIAGRTMPDDVINTIWGFTFLYIASYVVLTIALMATDVDLVTAFSAIATCLNQVGPGLGSVTANFQSINDVGIWICTFAMLLGRLEVFTLLVLFSIKFWRNG